MKLQLLQIATIAKYEIRMQWRRRTLVILLTVFLFATAAVSVPHIWQTGEFHIEQVLSGLPSGVLILIAVIPPLSAELLPLDRKYGMYDLIHTQPVSRAIYLTGKVLSLWGALFVGGTILIPLIFGVSVLTSRNVSLSNLLILGLTLLPYVLLPGGIAVLAAGMLFTRRQANLLGLLIAPWFLVQYVTAMKETPNIPGAFAVVLLDVLVVGVLVRIYLFLVEG